MRILLTFVFVLIAATCGADEIPPAGLESLPASDVVILGEVHDNPAHHLNQARAVTALKPAALVFEMLTPQQAGRITPDNRHDPAALEQALDWGNSGWPDFALYFPVFKAAPQAQIFGGNIARAKVRRAVKEGAAAVFGDGFDLANPLPKAEQSKREQGQMLAHCNALPENLLTGMVQAQRLRDAVLAAAILQAHAATGGPVAVITGNGHARADWGVPRLIAKAAPDLQIVTIAQFELQPWQNVPFDYYILTAETDREDPCAAFTKE